MSTTPTKTADGDASSTKAPSVQSTKADANGSTTADNTADLEKGPDDAPSATISDEKAAEEEADPNIVWWDGDDDPKNPMNWTSKKKWSLIAVLSFITFLTPLASSFFAPGVPQILQDFNTSSEELATFVVSVYVLGFGVGPLLIAPMSEMYGRMPLYMICNVFFVIFGVACAVSTSMGMLIAFRFLQGTVGSAPLCIGGGTIADIIPQQNRGGAMAIWALGPLFGPVIGPIAGGFLVDAEGWRWVYWVICIAGGFSAILSWFTLHETYGPVLLERKVKRLQKETGNPNLRSKLDDGISHKERLIRSCVRPTKMLFFSPIVSSLSLYMSVAYGLLYLLFTTFTFVFEQNYGFDESIVGLSYLGIGIGMMTGLFLLGIVSDKIIKNAMARGERITPEMRLPNSLTIPGGVCMAGGLFIYGWTVEKHVHWIVPIIGTGFTGFGLLAIFMCVQTYLVDAFTIHAASAIAANTVIRSIFGACLPLAGLRMYNALGLGWGNSLLGFVAFALVPVPPVLYVYGERIRTSKRFNVKF